MCFAFAGWSLKSEFPWRGCQDTVYRGNYNRDADTCFTALSADRDITVCVCVFVRAVCKQSNKPCICLQASCGR